MRSDIVAAILLAASLVGGSAAIAVSADQKSGAHPAAANGGAVAAAVGARPALRLGALEVRIEGVRPASGTILIGLFDARESFERAIRKASDSGYLNDPERVVGAAVRVSALSDAAVVFTHLAPGYYALVVFQDVNANGKLDKNAWGVPTEPYGFSNNAQGILGPPGFEDAKFWFDGCWQEHAIQLIHPSRGDDTEPEVATAEPPKRNWSCDGS